MKNIVIVNYGLGNPASIKNMIKKAGAGADITDDISLIEKADKLILPGVGHFGKGMQLLREKNLVQILNDKALKQKTPVLGICLGMQLLTNKSEEADVPGLGWIEAETVKFRPSKDTLKVPNMGWLDVKPQMQHLLFKDLETARFYFVHSYYVVPANKENLLASSVFEEDYASAIIKDNIMGVQFHPEKSHRFGLQMMKNFIEL